MDALLARSLGALRDGQGRRRQDDRRRGARARRRADRPAHDRVRGRRAGPDVARVRPPRACGPSRRSSSPRTCGRSRSTRSRRCEEWLGKQVGGTALADARALARVPVLRRRRAGREGADHDRQGVGARADAALGQAQPRLRPRRRRRARLRPRDRDAHDAADVRRDRARRADPPPGVQGLRDALATPRAPATSRSRCRRRCRSTRRSSSSGGCATAVGLGLDAIVMNAMWPERFSAGRRDQAARRDRDGRARPARRRARRAGRCTSA